MKASATTFSGRSSALAVTMAPSRKYKTTIHRIPLTYPNPPHTAMPAL
jgi:hypothetical protein